MSGRRTPDELKLIKEGEKSRPVSPETRESGSEQGNRMVEMRRVAAHLREASGQLPDQERMKQIKQDLQKRPKQEENASQLETAEHSTNSIIQKQGKKRFISIEEFEELERQKEIEKAAKDPKKVLNAYKQLKKELKSLVSKKKKSLDEYRIFDEAKENYEKKEKKKKGYESEIRAKKGTLEEKKGVMDPAIAHGENRIPILKSEIGHLEKRLATQKQHVIDFKKNIRDETENLRLYTQKTEQYNLSTIERENKLKKTKEVLVTFIKELENMEKDAESKRSEYTPLIEKIEKEKKAEKDMLDTKKGKKDTLEVEYNRLTENREKIKKEIDDLNAFESQVSSDYFTDSPRLLDERITEVLQSAQNIDSSEVSSIKEKVTIWSDTLHSIIKDLGPSVKLISLQDAQKTLASYKSAIAEQMIIHNTGKEALDQVQRFFPQWEDADKGPDASNNNTWLTNASLANATCDWLMQMSDTYGQAIQENKGHCLDALGKYASFKGSDVHLIEYYEKVINYSEKLTSVLNEPQPLSNMNKDILSRELQTIFPTLQTLSRKVLRDEPDSENSRNDIKEYKKKSDREINLMKSLYQKAVQGEDNSIKKECEDIKRRMSKSIEKTTNAYENDMKKFKDQTESYAKKINNYMKEYHELVGHANASIKRNEPLINKANRTYGAVMQDIDEILSPLIKEQIKEKERELDSLSDHIHHNTVEQDKIQHDIDRTDEKLGSISSHLHILSRERTTPELQIQKAKVKEHQKHVKSLEAEISGTKEEDSIYVKIEKTKEKIEKLEESLSTSEGKITSITKDIEEKQEDIEIIEDIIKFFKSSQKELMSEIDKISNDKQVFINGEEYNKSLEHLRRSFANKEAIDKKITKLEQEVQKRASELSSATENISGTFPQRRDRWPSIEETQGMKDQILDKQVQLVVQDDFHPGWEEINDLSQEYSILLHEYPIGETIPGDVKGEAVKLSNTLLGKYKNIQIERSNKWNEFIKKATTQQNITSLYNVEARIRARQYNLGSKGWDELTDQQQEIIRGYYKKRLELVHTYLESPRQEIYQEVFEISKNLADRYGEHTQRTPYQEGGSTSM